MNVKWVDEAPKGALEIDVNVENFFSALEGEERPIRVEMVQPPQEKGARYLWLEVFSESGTPSSGYSRSWSLYPDEALPIDPYASRKMRDGDRATWSNQVVVSSEYGLLPLVLSGSAGYTADYPPPFSVVYVYLWGEDAEEYQRRVEEILARREADKEQRPYFYLRVKPDNNWDKGFYPRRGEDGQPLVRARAVDSEGNMHEIPGENIIWKEAYWGWLSGDEPAWRRTQPYFVFVVDNPYPETEVEVEVFQIDRYAYEADYDDDADRVVSPFLSSETRLVWLSQTGHVSDAALPWLKPVVGPNVNEYSSDSTEKWVKARDLAYILNMSPLELLEKYHELGRKVSYDGEGNRTPLLETWSSDPDHSWVAVDRNGKVPVTVSLVEGTFPKGRQVIGQRRLEQGAYYVPYYFAEYVIRWRKRYPQWLPTRSGPYGTLVPKGVNPHTIDGFDSRNLYDKTVLVQLTRWWGTDQAVMFVKYHRFTGWEKMSGDQDALLEEIFESRMFNNPIQNGETQGEYPSPDGRSGWSWKVLSAY